MNRNFNTAPVWLDTIDSSPIVLERVSGIEWKRVARDENATEASLQKLLACCPEVLPLSEFSSVYSPVVCIAREASTKAGPIDLLYMSAEGRLVIVETKLYKNPESRREVIAQVLDYAAQITEWTYDDLNDRASKWLGKDGTQWPGLAAYIIDHFANAYGENFGEWNEDDFCDDIERNLRRGEILGLVVAEQVRRRTEDLMKYANRLPGLALELGIVELAFYRRNDQASPFIVVPNIVQKTAIVERLIVDVRVHKDGSHSHTVEHQKERREVITQGRKPQLASQDQFLDRVRQGTSTGVYSAAQKVVVAFAQIEETYSGLYEVGFQSTTCNLYWRQTDDQTRRIISISEKGRLKFITTYLKGAGADTARQKLAEVVSPLALMTPDTLGVVLVNEENVESVLAKIQEVAMVLAPILQEESQGI